MSVKNAEKVIKNYFRILKKTHAHLQTILKTPVKFQKDQPKTVGGVKGTKYLLKIRNHAPRAMHHGKPKTVSLRFSSKTIKTIKMPCPLLISSQSDYLIRIFDRNSHINDNNADPDQLASEEAN